MAEPIVKHERDLMIAGALLRVGRKHYNRLSSGFSLYRLFRLFLSHGLGLSFLFVYVHGAGNR